MYNIQQTQKFSQWLTKLKDMRARIAIVRRVERAKSGNLGDVKSVGESVYEMRIDKGVVSGNGIDSTLREFYRP
jgi:putative addiction module killer protein